MFKLCPAEHTPRHIENSKFDPFFPAIKISLAAGSFETEHQRTSWG